MKATYTPNMRKPAEIPFQLFTFHRACVKILYVVLQKEPGELKNVNTSPLCSCQTLPPGLTPGPFQHEVLSSVIAVTQRRASSAESWQEFALVLVLHVCSCLRGVQPRRASQPLFPRCY